MSKKTIECFNCGAVMDAKSKYCSNCGITTKVTNKMVKEAPIDHPNNTTGTMKVLLES